MKALEQLVEMGFKREHVVKAMRKAFHNPDRAVEYLMSGDLDVIGDVEETEGEVGTERFNQQRPQPPGHEIVEDVDEEGGHVPGTVSFDDEDFDDLIGRDASASAVLELFRNDPQFRQLRYLIQRDPALLEPTLQQIAQSNPILMEVSYWWGFCL